MDRRPRALVAALLLAALPALAADTPPLRAMRWLAPGTDLVAALAFAPPECLGPVAPEARISVETGRAAFASPLLLGGQAARAGLSCAACHRNGRGNPDFRFPGVSGAPGTADVTSSLLSSHRGDRLDNPVPIPDLAGPIVARKVDRDPAKPDLERFIRGLVVEEFDGAEPPPAVLAGLAAYVRALSPAACTAEGRLPLTVAAVASDADRAAAAAQAALAQGDRATAAVMLLAARAQLGLLDERFAGAALAADRTAIRQSDGTLAQLLRQLRSGGDITRPLVAWRADLPALARKLEAAQPASLFAPDRLAAITNG